MILYHPYIIFNLGKNILHMSHPEIEQMNEFINYPNNIEQPHLTLQHFYHTYNHIMLKPKLIMTQPLTIILFFSFNAKLINKIV